MPDQFLHGVEVLEITDGPRPISTVSSSVIGLVGFGGTSTAFPANTPVLITSAAQASSLTAGSFLANAIADVYTQTGAICVVVNTSDDTPANIAGSVSSLTGVYALRAAQSRLGYTPRILAVSKSYDTTVIAAVKSVASTLRAVAIVGLDSTLTTLDTSTEATQWVTSNGNDRTFAIWPYVSFDGGLNYRNPAPAVAGLMAANDNTNGFWWSPSNKEIFGITNLHKPVDFALGDSTTLANVLNEGEVTTIINLGGFKLWGNRTGSTDAKYTFVSVRRTADLIFDSIQRAHLWAVDRNITKTYLDDVSEGVNEYLRTLKNLGAILGGKCWPNKDLNTPANIAAGRVYFDFTFTPPYPAERVTFRAILTNEYLSELTA